MSRFFTKKSVAVIITTIILFSSFNFALAAVATPQTTPQPNTVTTTTEDTDWSIGGMFVNALIKSVTTLVSSVLNFVIIPLASFCLAAMGMILDYSIEYSIYGAGFTLFEPSIREVWTLLRDTANITFIFILLYAGIQQIISGSSKKDILVSVIMSAVLINFSLFTTKIFIDAGNLVATALYSQISKTGISGNASAVLVENVATSIGFSSNVKLSNYIMNGMDISTIWDVTGKGEAILSDTFMGGPDSIAGVGGLINSWLKIFKILGLFFAFIFLAVLFIGRFITLVILMATSPIGFVGKAVPFLGSVSSSWWKSLQETVLVAPAIMFFMLLTVKLSTVLYQTAPDNVFVSFLNFFFVMYLLFKSLNIVKGMSGEFGKIADMAGKAAAGLGLAAATGGAALAARGTLGAGASRLAASKWGTRLEGLANSNSMIGRAIGKTGTAAINKTATSTFDLRNTKVFGNSVSQLKNLTGADVLNKDYADLANGKYGKGKDQKTGYTGMVARDKEEAKKTGEEIKRRAEAFEGSFADNQIDNSLKAEREKLLKQLSEEKDPNKQKAINDQLDKNKQNIESAKTNAKETVNQKVADFQGAEDKIKRYAEEQKKLEEKKKAIKEKERIIKEKYQDGLTQAELDKITAETAEVENEAKQLDNEVKRLDEEFHNMEVIRETTPVEIRQVAEARKRRQNYADNIRKGLFVSISKYAGTQKERDAIAKQVTKDKTDEEKAKEEKAKERAEIAKEVAKQMKEDSK